MNGSLITSPGSFVGGPQRATPALWGPLPLNLGWICDLLSPKVATEVTLPVPDSSLKRPGGFFLPFSAGSDGKESACNAEDSVRSLDQEDPLEKGMATHSSILAWRIPRTEKPGEL